jgi:hypothetical protein
MLPDKPKDFVKHSHAVRIAANIYRVQTALVAVVEGFPDVYELSVFRFGLWNGHDISFQFAELSGKHRPNLALAHLLKLPVDWPTQNHMVSRG